MPKVPGAIPSAAAGVPYNSAKRTRLEYSTFAKTGLIDPAKLGCLGTSNWISLQLLYPELRIGLNIIGKIRSGAYWTTERLAKSHLISKIYRKKCPCCNVNVPENIEHILIDCKRWAAIRSEKIGQFIPRLFRICNDNNNEPLTQAKMKLVGKLLGGESKKSLLQLRKKKKPNMLPSMELETAKFVDGIRVARTLILDGIK
ncbi:hypothetical protein BB561_004905, partial [Smittium simulii]